MVNCKAILKYGPKKGERCTKKAKYTHMNTSYCGTHFRPYKKLRQGNNSLPNVTRRENTNGVVQHIINSIYPNQSKAADQILQHFKNGIKSVLLTAEMQSGKSGTAKDTIARFQEWAEDAVTSIVLTINDNELVEQMQREFGSYVSHNYIFKAVDLSSKFYLETLLNTNPNKKILIIIDESHYGNSSGGSLDTFFRNADIGLDGCNLPPNVYLLTISATSNAEIVLTNDKDISKYKRFVVLENGNDYYGIGDMLREDKLKPGWKLEGDLDDHSWQKLKTTIKSYCTGEAKYKIIRVNDSNGIKKLRELVSVISDEIGFQVKFISYDQHNKAHDINTIIGNKPTHHIVIGLAQKLRASKQLDTSYINMMFEYTKDGYVSTTVQGLPGRACGYGKKTHGVLIYTNIRHCALYNDWCKSGFKPLCTPNDKHVTHGVQGHETEKWEKNVPLELDISSITLSTSRSEMLKRLKPLYQQQFPNIAMNYPNPLSGTGTLIIKSGTEQTVKEKWWMNPMKSMLSGKQILGYPRSIKTVNTDKGFFLFVNLIKNRVLLTYTKKNNKRVAEPIVSSSCAFKPN